MVTLTASAILAVERFVNAAEGDAKGLRIIVSAAGRNHLHCGLRLEQSAQPTDQVVDYGAVKLFIDRESVSLIDGVTIDFVNEQEASGFRFSNLRFGDPLSSVRDANFRRSLPVVS